MFPGKELNMCIRKADLICTDKSCNRFVRWVLFLGLLATNSAMSDQTVTLHAEQLRVVRGETSNQSVDVLAVEDQQGSADDWQSYVEFYPAANGFVATLRFDIPESADFNRIEQLELVANYRGPARAEQRWAWHVRNQQTGRWTRLGDNRTAANWQWSKLNMNAAGNLDDYIDPLGRIKIRYGTARNTDDSNLDSVAINLTWSDEQEPTVEPPTTGIWSPSPGTSWQWQLTGAVDTSFNVQMYDIDLFDTPPSVIESLHNQGRVVICYFSAGSWENWRPDAGQFPAGVKGRSNGWAGEKWLDIRALDVLGPVMAARLDLAVAKGCDGVEPDNVDGYQNNSGFSLTPQDQLAFNIWLAEQAHARGLSIGLKNDLDQVSVLEPYFDWALSEQCYQYRECDALTPFVAAGKAVFGVEYVGDPGEFCSITNALDFDWLKKDLDLGASRIACR